MAGNQDRQDRIKTLTASIEECIDEYDKTTGYDDKDEDYRSYLLDMVENYCKAISAELSPCPFCGEHPQLRSKGFVFYIWCECGIETHPFLEAGDAVKCWENRKG